jgi:cell division protein FtsI (penicillin-binding protein 3)
MLRPSRLGVVHLALVAFAAALVVRAAFVQLWQGRMWADKASHEHAVPVPTGAPRGAILDAGGSPLAITRDVVEVGVAPREVRDRTALARALSRAGVSLPWIRRAVDVRSSWVVIPVRFLPGAVANAAAMRGVYATPVAERVSLSPPGLAAIVGHVAATGVGSDGLEAAMDSVLRGDAGQAVVMRDALGHTLETPETERIVPRAGDTIELTLNRSLQDICERALDEAVARMGATGGDIIVVDPQDGSILALASRRPDVGQAAATTLTEPFEPGSTLKPFIAAALLGKGRVAPTDVVDTHSGSITLNGRTINDTHHAPSMTLREVIRWSSNVGIVQFAERLSSREEYEALRDVGFGSPTGVPFPGESPGTLRTPLHWSKQSPASLAIGYEIAVTPLQLVLAYASIANGGELLEPELVREIRSPDGHIIYKRERRVVRRVMSPEIATQLRDILVETVAHGTAAGAELPSFVVAGKTGTARRTEYGAGYGRNEYTASFVGLFPGRDPQYVILVKLDNPKGSYFGGATAAPVSKAVLQAAIAAHDAALDLDALANSRRALTADTATPAPVDSAAIDSAVAGASTTVALGAPAIALAPLQAATAVIPDLKGASLRAAVRALHRAGLRVEIVSAPLGVTVPVAGTVVRAKSLVRLGDGS